MYQEKLEMLKDIFAENPKGLNQIIDQLKGELLKVSSDEAGSVGKQTGSSSFFSSSIEELQLVINTLTTKETSQKATKRDYKQELKQDFLAAWGLTQPHVTSKEAGPQSELGKLLTSQTGSVVDNFCQDLQLLGNTAKRPQNQPAGQTQKEALQADYWGALQAQGLLDPATAWQESDKGYGHGPGRAAVPAEDGLDDIIKLLQKK